MGPNAPVEWVRQAMTQLKDAAEGRQRHMLQHKLVMGIALYGCVPSYGYMSPRFVDALYPKSSSGLLRVSQARQRSPDHWIAVCGPS